MIDESTIVEAGRRIHQATPDARVILFGSYARSTTVGALSDIDLLVIEPEGDDPAEEAVRLRRTMKGMGLPVDVVVVDEERARRRASVPGTMVERALREGRVLVGT